ncbi:uncharacterized protein LOC143283296 [Babylonia areolata]|uniref:uncharacterized protein LOC143283296 n=1 Tax=Babylonia areolata TaxID=304850 RepID=UPI003FD354F8
MKGFPDDSNIKVDHQPNMVEQTPNYPYHVTFEAVPPVGLLSSTGPFLTADVTNPRELYSILSESRRHGAVFTSVTSSAQPSVRLPPLQSSSESIQFRPLGDQTQHSSYPDLTAFSRQPPVLPQQDPVWRSTSLQDVSSMGMMGGALTGKKLTPIPRSCDTKSPDDPQQEKENVTPGKTDAQLTRDQPLPPIEGKGGVPNIKGTLSSTDVGRLRKGGGVDFQSHSCPPTHRRCIFPRGQPVQVKKPLTPTYDDYPEAYWELRSPTLQDPTDLKEDMIDRDWYRLQQMSLHHLRAVNRDVLTSKLDSYRKWQQTMQEHLPPLVLSTKLDSPRGAGVHPTGALTSRRSWKQHRLSVPVQNHIFMLAPQAIGTSSNPAVKTHDDRMDNAQQEPARQAEVPVPDTDAGQEQEASKENEGEKDSHPKQETSKTANGGEKDIQKQDVKPVKASVVNLYIDPAPKSHTSTSDMLHPGPKKAHNGKRPESDRVGPQQCEQNSLPLQQQQQNGQVAEQLARKLSATSTAQLLSQPLPPSPCSLRPCRHAPSHSANCPHHQRTNCPHHQRTTIQAFGNRQEEERRKETDPEKIQQTPSVR